MDKPVDRRSRVYLNVPYKEKDEAKALGAKWDDVVQKWYVHEALTYHPSADVIKLLDTWGDGYDVPEPEHEVIGRETRNICEKITHFLGTNV